MSEFKDFYNDGFGWACRRCAGSLPIDSPSNARSRLLHEGEGESKQPILSTPALAKWADDSRRALICPRCGANESI